jgi:hypothetical protein
VPSDRRRIELALTERLRELVGPAPAERFVGGSHTRRFADNLLPTFPAWQVDELSKQLRAGGGSELTPSASGKRRAHAPYSSAALAFNAFGRWLGSESQLALAGLSGFTDRLRVEAKKSILHGGGLANLDVILGSSARVVGVESKLAEHSERHDPTDWKQPYLKPEMRALLDIKWGSLLEDSIAGRWQPRRLGAEQLVKHVLALRSQHPEMPVHLAYVFWEPVNADDHEWVHEHRAEVADLRERVAGSETSLHAMSYSTLLREWETLADPPAWLREHLEALRDRYSVSVPVA